MHASSVKKKKEKPAQWEAQAPQLEGSLHSLQPEKSPQSNEDPAQPWLNQLIKQLFNYNPKLNSKAQLFQGTNLYSSI